MKIIKYFVLIYAAFFISCASKQELTQALVQLKSKPIILPSKYTTIVNGKDSLIINYMNSNVKLIVYSDSISCSSCKIAKIYLWNSFIEYAKSCNFRLRIYFIYYPAMKDINNIKTTLRNSSFDYPILLDTLGEFERLNPHLPKNKAMHTFLLDENNKVILVGNPLYNKEIEKLFYKKTQELLSK